MKCSPNYSPPSSPAISSRKMFFQEIIAAKAKGSKDKGFFRKLDKVYFT